MPRRRGMLDPKKMTDADLEARIVGAEQLAIECIQQARETDAPNVKRWTYPAAREAVQGLANLYREQKRRERERAA